MAATRYKHDQGPLHWQVCEGLPSGEYEIKSAGPEDIEVRSCDRMGHEITALFGYPTAEIIVCAALTVVLCAENGGARNGIAERGYIQGRFTGLGRGTSQGRGWPPGQDHRLVPEHVRGWNIDSTPCIPCRNS